MCRRRRAPLSHPLDRENLHPGRLWRIRKLYRGWGYMQELTFQIDGMHCGACVRRVTSALQSVEGVTVNSVEVGSAKVAFDGSEITAQEITAALDRNGFPARVQS